MKIREDILGNKPQIGDTIVFNPPRYKGLVYGICVGFSGVGLPEVTELSNERGMTITLRRNNGNYTPKTGFVVIKSNNFKDRKIDN